MEITRDMQSESLDTREHWATLRPEMSLRCGVSVQVGEFSVGIIQSKAGSASSWHNLLLFLYELLGQVSGTAFAKYNALMYHMKQK
jgi:hypothetical protein